MRIPSLLFTILLIGVPMVSNAAFSDIAEQSPYRNAVEFLQQQQVIEGYTDGTFRPEIPVNRAEFLKMIMESRSEISQTDETKKYTNCFSDVTEEWFAPYICEAHSYGWIQGYTDGSFKPAQVVNKVEALKMLLEVRGYQEELTVVDTKYLFDDVRAGEWFAPYVSLAKRLNILEETSTLFRPGDDMHRGAIAEIIFREIIRTTQHADTYTEDSAEAVFTELGYTYVTTNDPTITPETGSGTLVLEEEQPTENESLPTEEETSEINTPIMMKTLYVGIPPTDRIPLKPGMRIDFPQSATQETIAVLSGSPISQPLTWELLKEALTSLRLDIESSAQIVELLEFQKRIDTLGRYAHIELLGGSIDEAGGILIDVHAEDPCYGHITSEYFFKHDLGLVEVRTISQEELQQACTQ